MDIYRQQILDHYKNPKNFGKLDNPDAQFETGNPLCGDRIGMNVKFKVKRTQSKIATPDEHQDEKLKVIEEIKFSGEGCAISMAAASMLTEKVKGVNIEDVKKLKYEDIKKMLGIDLSPARIKCAMLSLEVLQKTISLL